MVRRLLRLWSGAGLGGQDVKPDKQRDHRVRVERRLPGRQKMPVGDVRDEHRAEVGIGGGHHFTPGRFPASRSGMPASVGR